VKKYIKPADIILTAVFLAAAIAVYFLMYKNTAPDSIRITTPDGTTVVYPLGTDVTVAIVSSDYDLSNIPADAQIITTTATSGCCNIITIKDGAARMEYSTCANQVCIESGDLTRAGQTSICLPNRVSVEVAGEGGYDAITR